MAQRARRNQEEPIDDENLHEAGYGSSSSSEESDAEEAAEVLRTPDPTAGIPELRKALRTAQLAYTELRSGHRRLKQDYSTVSSLVSTRQLKAALTQGNRDADLDKQIVQQAKLFAMFYQFYLPENLFPTTVRPDIDPRNPSRWTSADTKLDGTRAELYAVVPRPLHRYMETYPRFGSIFRNTHRQERSNILRSIKEAASLVFTPLKLDSALISTQHASKGTELSFLLLLKRNGVGDYTRLAPILFEDPDSMNAEGFLRSPILVKIVRVMIYGKASLSYLKRGGPKARGERSGVRSVTEGLIAAAAIMARFVLTPDPELTDIGAITQIPYRADYDFYLERLFKRSHWANEVMDLFNREIFGQRSDSTAAASSQGVAVPSPSWEDNLLEQMDNPTPVSLTLDADPLSISDIAIPGEATVTSVSAAPLASAVNGLGVPAAAASHVPAAFAAPAAATSLGPAAVAAAPIAGRFSPDLDPGTQVDGLANPIAPPRRSLAVTPLGVSAPVDITTNSQSSMSISGTRTTSVALSTTSKLQVDLGKMSISGTGNTDGGSAATARRVSNRKVTPAIPVPAVNVIPDLVEEQGLVDKPVQPVIARTTRARAKPKTKAPKA